MYPVICSVRDVDGNITYFRANDKGTKATVQLITPDEPATVYDGDFADALRIFMDIVERAGGLPPEQSLKFEEYNNRLRSKMSQTETVVPDITNRVIPIEEQVESVSVPVEERGEVENRPQESFWKRAISTFTGNPRSESNAKEQVDERTAGGTRKDNTKGVRS